MYLLKLLADKQHFELIHANFVDLYAVDKSELIALTEEQYQSYLAIQAQDVVFIDGKFKARPQRPSQYHEWNEEQGKFVISPENLTALLTEKKSALLQQIANKTDEFKSQYLAGYSQAEIDSFYRQEREARGELPLMLLTEIFEGRDDLKDIEALKKKVIDKADLFAIIMGKLFAIKQNFEKHIEEAESLEALSKIEQEINQWQKL